MSKRVTPLNPYFVVQRFDLAKEMKGMEFYATEDDGSGGFVEDPYRALLFTSLTSASFVAQAEAAEVRAIASESDYEEFRK